MNWPAGDFTWTAAGAWGSFLMLCGVIARQVGPWRKQSIDAEKEFRDGLIARVEKLEKDLEGARKEAKEEREKLQAEREAAKVRHEAERSLDRHRINNLQACFDATMMLLKASPGNAAHVVEYVEKLRSDQLKAEALEKASIHVAAIQRTEGST